jgi:uncharacterized protein (TIGR02145 family)
MKKTKLLTGIIPVFLFSFSSLVLKAQIPAAIDTKMKSDNMRNFQVEEIKVRWKKAALENCPGVPCVTGPGSSFTCGTSTIADIDGNSYNTVSIGTQCWLKENLRVGKYNDGTVIPLDATGGTAGSVSGEGWSGLSSGAKTVYEHNPVYLNALGYLYNAYAAIDPRGICPSGWKVPTISEWQTLETFLRVGSEVGHKMMVTTTPYGWNQPLKNNSLGFSALSSGSRIGFQYSGSTFHGKFTEAGVPGNTSTTFHAAWWSSTPVSSSTNINNAYLEDGNSNSSLWLDTRGPTEGMSIRCIKI